MAKIPTLNFKDQQDLNRYKAFAEKLGYQDKGTLKAFIPERRGGIETQSLESYFTKKGILTDQGQVPRLQTQAELVIDSLKQRGYKVIPLPTFDESGQILKGYISILIK